MPLLNDKCNKCHTIIRGKEQSLFDYWAYGLIDTRIAAKCTTNYRNKEVDEGKLVKHKEQKQVVARCISCGRKDKSKWLTTNETKEWKDGECE